MEERTIVPLIKKKGGGGGGGGGGVVLYTDGPLTTIYIHPFAQMHASSLFSLTISQGHPTRSLGVNY